MVTRAEAQTLYGSTSSGHGELYILNPATGGVLQDVGALNDSGANNYSVTGLAFDPLTGVLYGSTGGMTGTVCSPSTRLTDWSTWSAPSTPAPATMTDLAFDQSGNLYGISSTGGANLYSINLGTAQATLIGASGVSFTEGGGLAISSGGFFTAHPIPVDTGPTTRRRVPTLISQVPLPGGRRVLRRARLRWFRALW